MPAVLVEVCFCEATEDVRIYREKGPDLIGKLIAEAINEKEIEENIKPEGQEDSLKEKFLKSTNAKAIANLDPRDNPSSIYKDLGEIYKGERTRVLPEICDKKDYLPIIYWKDTTNIESQKVWVSAKQNYLKIDTNATVINVVTELDARYIKSQRSSKMGWVKNGERLYVHKIESGYALGTYFASNGYKTAWFTAKYISLD